MSLLSAVYLYIFNSIIFFVLSKNTHLKLAAIDIGNAARLLISEVVETENKKPEFNKLNLVRVPLRLGFDVFEKTAISPEKQTCL
jgi:exopolyphosphatase/guanosine-5'-triphosphate,3'-diphosphate pyrophosphatase